MWPSVGFVFLCALPCVSGTSVEVTTTPNGDGKFSAVITISATEKVNGWEVVLTFESAITKLDVSIKNYLSYMVPFSAVVSIFNIQQ